MGPTVEYDRITQYPKLEGTHKHHRVQLPCEGGLLLPWQNVPTLKYLLKRYLSPAGVHHLKHVVHVVHQGQELLVFIVISLPKDNGAYDVGDSAAQLECWVKGQSCEISKVTVYK